MPIHRHPSQPVWPFPPLTPEQQRAHDAQLQALRAGALRRLPTVFGELDEVAS